MKSLFNIKLLEFKTIDELPEAWTINDYKALLNAMEYGDISDIKDEEIQEMCLMYLSDNETEDAASIILDYVFNERLNAGQKENLSHEMLDEKVWEEYADISLHEAFFNVHQILYKAYNGKFPHPEAVSFQFEVSAKNSHILNMLNENTEASILRLLVQGMPENTLINRLYDEQLEAGPFEEAKDIIWQIKKQPSASNNFVYSIISSSYWFKDLKYAEVYEAELKDLDIDINNA